MKVLQITKFYPPFWGGIETVTYDITEGLNKRGIQCDVLCSNHIMQYEENTRNKHSIYRTKSYGRYFSTSISPQLITKLKTIIHNYDIIHLHAPDPMATIALLLSNCHKQKIVIHWHSDIIKQRLLFKLYKPIQNKLLQKADRIITTSQKYQQYSSQLEQFKSKCIAVPIGINPTQLTTNKSCVINIKNKYNNKKIIFSLGRLTYYKGYEYLIESALHLSNDYVVLIGGVGELYESLDKLIKNLNLSDKVFLLGKIPQPDLGSYYQASDIFCLPSIEKSEAFGVVLIEAMSFSKPIVATKIKGSGVDWVNQHNKTGYNVEIKKPKALSKAFTSILSNTKKYEHFSRNSYQRFVENFQQEHMINEIEKIYLKL